MSRTILSPADPALFDHNTKGLGTLLCELKFEYKLWRELQVEKLEVGVAIKGQDRKLAFHHGTPGHWRTGFKREKF